MVPTPATPPVVTPPPANVPRKAQVGGSTRGGAKVKNPPAVVAGPKKATPTKPPVTRSKTKNQPMAKKVAVVDPESDRSTATPVDEDYDTDGLAELPTDSEPKVVESDSGEENAQFEEQ